MGNGLDDNGTYNRMTRTLPKQPSRCTGVMTFYDQPNFQLFLKQVKKVIRTCVQEGRENELLDNNPSLVSAWNELQQQPVSMNLAKGRKIELVPQYDWERTSGPPFWRTTQITFLVQRKKLLPRPFPNGCRKTRTSRGRSRFPWIPAAVESSTASDSHHRRRKRNSKSGIIVPKRE
jgi:hypothetical protein